MQPFSRRASGNALAMFQCMFYEYGVSEYARHFCLHVYLTKKRMYPSMISSHSSKRMKMSCHCTNHARHTSDSFKHNNSSTNTNSNLLVQNLQFIRHLIQYNKKSKIALYELDLFLAWIYGITWEMG